MPRSKNTDNYTFDVPVVLTNSMGTVTDVNPMAQRYLPIRRGENIAQYLKEPARAEFEAARRKRESRVMQFDLDGSYSTAVFYAQTRDDKPVFVFQFLSRNELSPDPMEKTMENAERDVMQSLALLTLAARELQQLPAEDTENRSDALRRIEKYRLQLLRLETTAREYRHLDETDAGKKEPHDLIELISVVCARFRPYLKDAVHFTVTGASDARFYTDLDTARFAALITPLLFGAYLLNEDDVIDLTARQGERSLTLTIRYKGQTLTPSACARAFVRQEEPAEVDNFALRLAMSTRLCRSLGWEIRLYSVDDSSCIELTVPKITSGDSVKMDIPDTVVTIVKGEKELFVHAVEDDFLYFFEGKSRIPEEFGGNGETTF